jgi:hypothetical protein
MPRLVERLRGRPITYLLMGAVVLLLDLLTGRYLLFPILFVVPVTLAAWYCQPLWYLALAGLLPLGRLVVAAFVDAPAPLPYSLINALVRILVLAFVGLLANRVSRHTRDLEHQVHNLVTICAWSHTIEYRGEWLSVEDYLHRRFGLTSTHGVSPAEAERLLSAMRSDLAERSESDA